MASGPSFVGRAVLAVALLIGFYLMALVVIALLVALPFLEMRVTHSFHYRLAIVCLFGAGIVAWSILPRFDKFVPPGPRLTPEEHPRLFAEIQDVARATGQAMPAEVYLDPSVNAWVAQRGGLMGFGSRRVMALGLPLMAVLSVPQLRAVMAHEFGHFYGGDTKLGPWIYKTRAAVIRTVSNLAKARRRVLHAVFLAYCKIFLRITHAISRRQELAADALAARVAGARAQADALQAVHRAALAFDPFIREELDPVLSAGYLPPVADGFVRFMESGSVTAAVDKAVEKEMKENRKDPYDTHPPLKERLAALGVFTQESPSADDCTPALSLLSEVPQMEQRLLKSLARKDFRPIGWDEVGQRVYLVLWHELLKERGSRLKGLTPADLPAAVQPADMARRFGGVEHIARGSALIGMALATVLLQRGWSMTVEIGSPVVLRQGDMEMRPFDILGRLAKGDLAADAWRQTCAAAGIDSVDLGTV